MGCHGPAVDLFGEDVGGLRAARSSFDAARPSRSAATNRHGWSVEESFEVTFILRPAGEGFVGLQAANTEAVLVALVQHGLNRPRIPGQADDPLAAGAGP